MSSNISIPQVSTTQLAILTLLGMIPKQERYGAAIHRQYEKTTGTKIRVLYVYMALTRLKQRGFVRSYWTPAERNKRGRGKVKAYELTALGKLVVGLAEGIETSKAHTLGGKACRTEK
jgi:DNA-binding PadR family transcriptional regulator